MTFAITLTISLLILFTLLSTGQYVGAAVGLTGLILLQFLLGGSKALISIIIPWSVLNNFTFIALPAFILMGSIVMHSGLGASLYRGISPWVSRLPGGLLHTNIATCAVFSAISGSSVATAATVGAMAIPEQGKLGYDRSMVLGTLAGAGTLGLLIPPSISFIVYASLTGESLGHLFIAGVCPGVMITAIFMIYTAIRVLSQPSLVPSSSTHLSPRVLVMSFRDMWPVIILIGGVISAIYLGLATVIEVAALGVLGAVILAGVHKRLSWQVIQDSLCDCVRTTCLINFVVIGALILQFAWGNLTIPRQLALAVVASGTSRWIVLALVYLIYLGLGCLFDGVSMMVLTLPIIYPLILSLSFDPIWFGVTLTLLIEIAQITPPVGLNLYVLAGTANCSVSEVLRGSIPFFFLLLFALAILTVLPDLCLWLPSLMK